MSDQYDSKAANVQVFRALSAELACERLIKLSLGLNPILGFRVQSLGSLGLGFRVHRDFEFRV